MIVCVPTPAILGLKTPPDTPGPLYLPPSMEPPVKVRGLAPTHISAKDSSVTAVTAFTSIIRVVVFVHPLAFV